MLYCNKIDALEGIDINKSNKLKEYMIFHCWYFFNLNYTYELQIYNRYHDISMMAYDLENIVILNIKDIDYK